MNSSQELIAKIVSINMGLQKFLLESYKTKILINKRFDIIFLDFWAGTSWLKPEI